MKFKKQLKLLQEFLSFKSLVIQANQYFKLNNYLSILNPLSTLIFTISLALKFFSLILQSLLPTFKLTNY